MKTTLKIQNLKCGGCANTIITKISNIDQISDVNVNVEESTVTFTSTSEGEIENVKNKLSTLGYPIEGDNNSVISKAKSYVSCATGKMSQ